SSLWRLPMRHRITQALLLAGVTTVWLIAWIRTPPTRAEGPGEKPVEKKPAAYVEQANDQANERLMKPLPEVNFNGNNFADVIDFLRDVTGTNIFVNWRALEAVKITKEAPVTARLEKVTFAKVLDTVLESVAGGKGKLGWIVDEGVITISTADDL